MADDGRVCMLPPEYTYPFNLHHRVPAERLAQQLNDLVTIAYEERSLDPACMNDIAVSGALRSWLDLHHDRGHCADTAS